MDIPGNQCTVQRLDNIFVPCPGACQYLIIVHIHVGLGNISGRDHSHQFLILQDRYRLYILLLHLRPRILDRYIGIHSVNLMDIHILDLKLHIL